MRIFLRKFQEQAKDISPLQVSTLLLSLLYKTADTRAHLADFASHFSVNLADETYTEKDFKELEIFFQNQLLEENEITPELIEKMIFWLIKHQQKGSVHIDVSSLITDRVSLSYKGPFIRPLCAEETLRTMINLFLFNSTTELLDVSVLPPALAQEGKKRNPNFYAFIEQNANTKQSNYYEKTAAEWLALVSEVPGIIYKQPENFEVKSSPDQILKLLCHLLGISSCTSYKELSQLLSTPNRTVTLEQKDTEVLLSIAEKTSEMKEILITARAHFPSGHATIQVQDGDLSDTALYSIETVLSLTMSEKPLQFLPASFMDMKTISAESFKGIIAQQKELLINHKFLEKILTCTREDLKQALLDSGPEISDDFIKNIIRQENSSRPGTTESLLQFCITHTENKPLNPQFLFTAIIYACSPETIKTLLQAGISIQCQDEDKNTPLHYAFRNSDLIKLLLAQGANPNAQNRFGKTPLHDLSTSRTSAEPFLALFDSGLCDFSIKDNEGKTALEYVTNPDIIRPFFTAMEEARISPTKKQLQHLTQQLAITIRRNDTAFLEILLKAGCDVNALLLNSDLQGTSLHEAVWSRASTIIPLLLQTEANPNTRDKFGRTPLHWASCLDRTFDCFQELIASHKCDLRIKDNQGKTALDLARSYNNAFAYAALLKEARNQQIELI